MSVVDPLTASLQDEKLFEKLAQHGETWIFSDVFFDFHLEVNTGPVAVDELERWIKGKQSGGCINPCCENEQNLVIPSLDSSKGRIVSWSARLRS